MRPLLIRVERTYAPSGRFRRSYTIESWSS
jgi:hypothetical protein